LLIGGTLKASRILGDLTAIRAVSGNLITNSFKVDTDY